VGWLLLLTSDLFPPHLILKGVKIFRIQTCDFTSCFSWYEHWCLALGEEQKLGIFENGMRRTINGHNRTERGMLKSFIICTVQQTVLGWVGQGMFIKWDKVNACKIFFVKQIKDETPWKIMLAWVDSIKIDLKTQSGFI